MAGNVMEVTDQNFGAEVESAGGLVLVDFWAPWCMPCRLVAPSVQEIAAEYAGRVKVVKVNVDDSAETATSYGIRSIPTLALFKDGAPVGGVVGAVPKATLVKLVEEHLPAAA